MEEVTKELRFENEEGGEINEIFFRRTIKGIPSLVTKFYVKNLSTGWSFRGKLNVAPAYGKSYSEDLGISSTGEFWAKTVEFELDPDQRVEFRARVVPVTTAAGVTGRASVNITGEWL